MPWTARSVRSVLLGKLHCEEMEGRRHKKYRVYQGDQVIAATLISRGASELSDGLFSQMARELCIQSQVLKEICRCPYGWKEYLEHYDPDLNPYRR